MAITINLDGFTEKNYHYQGLSHLGPKETHNIEVDEFLEGQTTLSKIHPFLVNGKMNPSFETATTLRNHWKRKHLYCLRRRTWRGILGWRWIGLLGHWCRWCHVPQAAAQAHRCLGRRSTKWNPATVRQTWKLRHPSTWNWWNAVLWHAWPPSCKSCSSWPQSFSEYWLNQSSNMHVAFFFL